MTAPRPIRPIDADKLINQIFSRSQSPSLSDGAKTGLALAVQDIKSAPTLPQPEPVAVADGDAISRKAVIELVSRIWVSKLPYLLSDLVHELHQLPSIPATPALDVDVVTAEDVVEGVWWFDGTHDHKVNWDFENVASLEHGGFNFSKKAVAAMLNVAETVTWPGSHRRSAKPKSIDDQIDEVGNLYNRGQLGAQEAFSKIYELAKKAVEANK